jgi:hypothetical protein
VIPQDVDHRVRNIIASHLDVDVHRLGHLQRVFLALPEQETSSLVTYGDLLTVVADRVGAEA